MAISKETKSLNMPWEQEYGYSQAVKVGDTIYGVDPVSWTLHLLGRRSPRCRSEELHIRRSSGGKWLS